MLLMRVSTCLTELFFNLDLAKYRMNNELFTYYDRMYALRKMRYDVGLLMYTSYST